MPRTGGGINSKVVSNVNAPKREPISHAVSPGAVSRMGGALGVGSNYKALYSGAGYSTPQGPTDGMGQGPGSNGRQIMRSGSQGQHGSAVSGVARPGANKPIFPSFK
jgi:hypothetical protein